ncbi:PhoX family protein [Roseicella aquatilis]|nr:alkaline phosphatase PhoX [Roseicella aquatilis]
MTGTGPRAVRRGSDHARGGCGRRALLAAPALLLPGPAPAQVLRGDLAGMPLPVRQDDTVAAGYRRDALVRWGDRVTFDAPAWDPRQPEPEGAAAQFGWDARLAGIAVPRQPAADGIPRAVMAVVHPTVDPVWAFPGGRDQPLAAAAMQGASLLNLEKRGRGWIVVDGGFQSRRLGGATLCRISGPAGAGSVRGVLGLGGGCVTPWGTLLLAEGDPAPWLARLAAADPRFGDGAGFGWVVELDPFDPQSVPVKRSALGRFAHGDVAATLSRDGRAVVYQTDRRVGGYLFRFLSAGPATTEDVLDAGTLAVARLEGDRLAWLPLPAGADPVAAARQAGGSALDTPSGLGLDPRRARLLLACHGSPARPAGHVIEVTAKDDDDGADSAGTALLFAAGDPRGPEARYGRGGLPPGSAWPEHPDTVTVDGNGRAWIGTDRGGRVGPQAEGLYGCDLDGPGRGVPLPLYGAPRAGSIGGAALTPDGEALFTTVRHPGAEPGSSFERPATRWPEFRAGVPPRSTLLGLVRNGGGPVGG